jgi:imidazoleglycerol-phosphate dehydratase
MASAYVPMDEALAFVSLDLSGRPYAVIQVDWRTPALGEIPTSLLTHFSESLAVTLRANLLPESSMCDDHRRRKHCSSARKAG